MKKDENSGVSIKQIMITTLFLIVTTLGGLNTYRIVCDEKNNTIQEVESVNLNNYGYESALVENTEEDIVYSENIKYLSVSIIDKLNQDTNIDTIKNQKDLDFSGKVISRGDFVREQVAEDISKNIKNSGDNEKKLLKSVISEIKELSEKQESITKNINSKEEIEISGETLEDETTPKTEVKLENQENGIKVEEKAENMQNTQTHTPPTEYLKTIDVKATAYCLCKKCCGKSPSNPNYGVTASGFRIIPGQGMKIVASDPKVIPLGTKVYIEGLYGAKDYGYATVADTGSAIKNLKIDLYMDTHQMALNWGVKTVRVYILEK
ncbi:MAG: hypothetical protein J6C46_12540 [Clostridia bacterium]|nr:hypothetical protein [Clostridia bacterium]